MKAKELLKVDFNNYKRILINGIIVYPTKILVSEADLDDSKSKRIVLEGYKGKEEIFYVSYEENEVLGITANEKQGLISIRREVGKDETN